MPRYFCSIPFLFMKKIIAAIFLFSLFSCNNNNNDNSTIEDANNPPPPTLSYRLIKEYPHDTTHFTEGLIWHNNALYESTGEEGESQLLKLDLNTGKAEQKVDLPDSDFGEGIAIIGDKIYQLTYRNHKAYEYDLATFKKLKEFTFPYEGWGMTTDGKQLIIGTGSSNLYFVNPDNFQIKNTLGVTDNYGPVSSINELEYVAGYVYANVWHEKKIIKIDLQTGKVVGVINIGDILSQTGKGIDETQEENHEKVLNGIAFDSTKNSFYITGKNWPSVYEIKLN